MATFVLDEEFPTKQGNELIRFLIEVVGITFVILLIGEVIPKIYATNNAEKASRWVARPLYLISRTPPVSWLKWVLVSGSKFISLSKNNQLISQQMNSNTLLRSPKKVQPLMVNKNY